MLPARDFSMLAKPSWSLGSWNSPSAPSQTSPSAAQPAEHLAARTASAPPRVPAVWRDHVKSVYTALKAVDPSTSYKEAMTHAKASWTKF
jgi:hypothetical protein